VNERDLFIAALERHDPAERDAYLAEACGGDMALLGRVKRLLRLHQDAGSFLEGRPVAPNETVAPSGGAENVVTVSQQTTDPTRDSESRRPTVAASPEAAPDRRAVSRRYRVRRALEAGGFGTVYLGNAAQLDRAAASKVLRRRSSRPQPEGELSLPFIEGYEVLGELGRGGMGVVYRARHLSLNRPCVLKMILAGDFPDAEAIVRFRAEAEAVARLRHNNVVQIHGTGEAAGRPFFELEYVEGGSLDHHLDGAPWPPRRAAELVEALARGVAEAHRLGIVHRDLKPANVLVAADGTPKITDFGLAKSLAGDSGLTQTGAIVGTPDYMAPEQAEGKPRDVGPLADVYALGAILYELLTGRRPFRGATVLETLHQVRTTEPVRPSRLVPGLRRDVETIALKCLQKEPAKRYASAAALAEDLRRFLGGEPIVARPVGPIERAWRWCRRHPAPASLTAAVVLVAALGLMGVLWQWSEAVKARNLESIRAFAEGEARQQVETTLVDMYTTSGIQAGDQGENGRAALWFANAARRARGDRDRQRANAIRARTWGRRAFVPLHAFVAEGTWPGGIVFHPKGRYLITKTIIDGKTRDARHTLWDLDAEQSLPFPDDLKTVPAAAWSPGGRTLAVGRADGDVILSSFPIGGEVIRIRFPARIRLLSYSADGRYLAIAGGNSTRVWDRGKRAFATPELVHPAEVTTLAFHPEGRYLATGCRDNLARVFGVPNDAGKPLWPPVPHVQVTGSVWYPVFFSPPLFIDGGKGLITYSDKGGLTWRAAETGAKVRTLDFREWSKGVAATRLSPDGRYLAIFGVQLPGTVRLVDITTARLVRAVLEHKNTVFDAAFSPDGRMLLTSSSDGTARLWSVPGGEAVTRPFDLHRTVHQVAFAPDGRTVATQDHELVRLWARPQEGLPKVDVDLDPHGSFAALSPDGALVIPTGASFDPDLRSTRAHRVDTGKPTGPPLRPGGRIVDAAFSPDGQSVATLDTRDPKTKEGPEIGVWDYKSGQRRWRAALPSGPRSVCYNPDGRLLAVLCGGGELIVFDPGGREVRRWQAHEPERADHWINNGKVGFSPDGGSLLTWGMGKDVRVWDPDTGQLRYPPLRHRDKCHDVQFSPDGKLMALASYDHSVRVHDLATGKVLAELPEHPDMVYSASFSPDGRLLATACRDRCVRVWDWRAGRLVCPQFEHGRDVTDAVFTPDGHWVLSASDDGTARAWDWRTGKPVTPPLMLQGVPRTIVVTPQGKHAVVGGYRTQLTVLDLRELARESGDVDALCTWAELVAGQRLHEGGGTVNLSAAEWLHRWRKFTKNGKGGRLSN
jgi:WD40 repeat protein/serine/threonine protein kinase